MSQQINSVTIGGNLTRDPELRTTGSGLAVCSLRIANNRRRKNSDTGQWEDRPGYFDVTVWGAQGENCAKYLSKGKAVMVKGELRWREWTSEQGQKRQAVDVNADEVQFLTPVDRQGGDDGYRAPESGGSEQSDYRAPESAAGGVGSAVEDDIPF